MGDGFAGAAFVFTAFVGATFGAAFVGATFGATTFFLAAFFGAIAFFAAFGGAAFFLAALAFFAAFGGAAFFLAALAFFGVLVAPRFPAAGVAGFFFAGALRFFEAFFLVAIARTSIPLGGERQRPEAVTPFLGPQDRYVTVTSKTSFPPTTSSRDTWPSTPEALLSSRMNIALLRKLFVRFVRKAGLQSQ
jgi:hypothetical protein